MRPRHEKARGGAGVSQHLRKTVLPSPPSDRRRRPSPAFTPQRDPDRKDASWRTGTAVYSAGACIHRERGVRRRRMEVEAVLKADDVHGELRDGAQPGREADIAVLTHHQLHSNPPTSTAAPCIHLYQDIYIRTLLKELTEVTVCKNLNKPYSTKMFGLKA